MYIYIRFCSLVLNFKDLFGMGASILVIFEVKHGISAMFV